ncbi:hypothetical protein F5B22DRAFT_514281 [Xylaria bambusicola]|uniref:uncharacterized protein n=1 Tax=Xylaria bambusicola TaxID=326684 RepID=UPI002007AFCD|nr:uncharacterized protein F5B22DRAFT_514281 [Xylaria bambusicola]KAI0522026.1 hypothetical protein F5B22DRAFT_514281 [Xylaria bambusicola]
MIPSLEIIALSSISTASFILIASSVFRVSSSLSRRLISHKRTFLILLWSYFVRYFVIQRRGVSCADSYIGRGILQSQVSCSPVCLSYNWSAT